jgi:hypothetical protein
MATIGLVLYGSRTRGDHTEESDVDLLAVTRGEPRASYTHGRVSVSRYPLDHVVGRARAGDLFAFHIVSEGRVVYEQEPVFETIASAFTLRSDYSREIGLASNVGWLLLHHRGLIASAKLLNEKMAWCTHSVLVARAATERLPVFSTAGLAEFAGSSDVAVVLRHKRCSTVSDEATESFRRVLGRFGSKEPPALRTLAAERRRFEADRNHAGVNTVRLLIRQSPARATGSQEGVR